MKLCVDLCAGLGGFSQAFKNRSDWEVITVDIALGFATTVCADVRDPHTANCIEEACSLGSFKAYERVVVVASPPCERFSLGNRMFPKKGIRQALDIVGACLDIIAEIRPHSWVLENPKGRLRWFLGKPKATIDLSNFGRDQQKPTDLWGNFNFPMVQQIRPHIPYHKSKAGKLGPDNPLRSALRAELPYEFSEAVLKAVS